MPAPMEGPTGARVATPGRLGEPDIRGLGCEVPKGEGARSCRDLTHFCHEVMGPGYKTAVCCPMPCRNPLPLFINVPLILAPSAPIG